MVGLLGNIRFMVAVNRTPEAVLGLREIIFFLFFHCCGKWLSRPCNLNLCYKFEYRLYFLICAQKPPHICVLAHWGVKTKDYLKMHWSVSCWRWMLVTEAASLVNNLSLVPERLIFRLCCRRELELILLGCVALFMCSCAVAVRSRIHHNERRGDS